MGEGLVGLGHTMGVFLLLDGGAAVLRGVQELARQPGAHRLLAAPHGAVDDPAHRQRQLAGGAHLDGDLVGRAADAPGLHLDRGLDVLDRLLEHLHRIVVRLRPDGLQGVVQDALGDRLLAFLHHHVDELGDQLRVVERIRQDLALRDLSAPGHDLLASLSLRTLGAVLGTALTAGLHADRVERAPDDVIADAREILHAAAADQDDRVLLQVVPDARDVGGHLDAVGEAYAGHLAEGRVRLLGRLGVHADADAALLRRGLQSGALGLRLDAFAALAHQLMNRRHASRSPRDPLNPMFFRGATRRRPHTRGVSRPTLRPRTVFRVLVFGLKTSTAPVPGGTIGGETRRVYIERPARVNRQSRPDLNQVGQRDAQYNRSAPAPQGRRFELLQEDPPAGPTSGTDLETTAGGIVFQAGGGRPAPALRNLTMPIALPPTEASPLSPLPSPSHRPGEGNAVVWRRCL